MSTLLSSEDPAVVAVPSAAGTAIRSYSVLGGVLRTGMDFPELPQTTSRACDWTLDVIDAAPPELVQEPLGERRIGEERYTLSRTAHGYRLVYSHAGCFEISEDGARLRWYPNEAAQIELARAIVLGPALALALELRGLLCLHGSAVEIDGRAIAFVGPKFYGKSTLATALTTAGARLVSDDLLAVTPTASPRVRAGIPSVRLWNDAADRLDVESICDAVLRGVKTTATGFAGRLMDAPDAELAAIYLLAPIPPDAAAAEVEESCRRVRIQGAQAAIELAHQTKLPPNLVGRIAAGKQLMRAAAVAGAIPVWKLHLVHDFTWLDASVARILAWHDDSAAAAEAESAR